MPRKVRRAGGVGKGRTDPGPDLTDQTVPVVAVSNRGGVEQKGS